MILTYLAYLITFASAFYFGIKLYGSWVAAVFLALFSIHHDPKIIATGGSAGALPASWLPEITFDPNITLLGLAEAHRRWTAGER